MLVVSGIFSTVVVSTGAVSTTGATSVVVTGSPTVVSIFKASPLIASKASSWDVLSFWVTKKATKTHNNSITAPIIINFILELKTRLEMKL